MPGLHTKQQAEPLEEVVEEIKGDSELMNDITRFPAGRHEWRQQGTFLVCRGCPLTHAVHVGIDRIMVGEDEDGKPIMRKR